MDTIVVELSTVDVSGQTDSQLVELTSLELLLVGGGQGEVLLG